MNPQASSVDSRINAYASPQMQHFSVQRIQNCAERNDLTGRPDLFSSEHKTLNIGAQLQRDRYEPNGYNQMPTLAYIEVSRSNRTSSCIHDQTTDPKFSQENQANQEKDQPHEQDMEIGYEDNPPQPTFEGIEQRFLDEIMKLAKEQSDAEDAEISRHKERMLEINTKYQEKLSALRALQAARREDFLRKELQARINQYNCGGRNHGLNKGMPDAHGYIGPVTYTPGKAIRTHAAGQYKPDGEQTQSSAEGRTQGSEARVPFPPGHVYNTSKVYH